MQDRSHPPLSVFYKLNTDRSQHNIHTTRYQGSNIFDHSTHKNTSQIIARNSQKSLTEIQEKRKKEVSSYYFRNCKKNGKIMDGQTFSKYLKNKNQGVKKKRSVTSVNLATNKITLPIQQKKSLQKPTQIIEISQQSCSKQNLRCCLNHPSKTGYFEQQNSFDCYCHQCSIQQVKNNKRLIQISPEISRLNTLIKKKIAENYECGEQLCEQIMKKVQQNKKSLEKQYHQLKIKLINEMNQITKKIILSKQQSAKTMSLKIQQIDWSFINTQKSFLQQQFIQELKFLNPINKPYVISLNKPQSDLRSEIDEKKVKAQKDCPQNKIFKGISNSYSTSNHLQAQSKIPSKNLIKQIQKALNYQSKRKQQQIKQLREKKHVKSVKQQIKRTINLKTDKTLFNFTLQNSHGSINSHESIASKEKQRYLQQSSIIQTFEYFNKENICPNLMMTNNTNQHRDKQQKEKQMIRMSFGGWS